MALPVTLYGRDGQMVTVYTERQAEAMLGSGRWFATATEAEAGQVPAAQSAPAPEAARVVRRPARGKAL